MQCGVALHGICATRNSLVDECEWDVGGAAEPLYYNTRVDGMEELVQIHIYLRTNRQLCVRRWGQ
jgi:hypothetical protein